MKLNEIVEKLELEVKTGGNNLNVEVVRGYSSDLLSDVMANAQEGDIWITMQTHQNIVAVAVLKTLAAIILVNNRNPDDETTKKAKDENLPILTSNLSTFELIGKLYQLGISGSKK
jgi:predicted transcriptional regulator